jgi:hypothetical protein
MKKFMIVIILILGIAASVFAGPYEDWLATCKDYKCVAKWSEDNWRYDTGRLKYLLSLGKEKKFSTYSPRKTFTTKSGVCMDWAVFAKDSLNRINPSYKAEVLLYYKSDPPAPIHCVTLFTENGKFLVMNYGTVRSDKKMGMWGPYNSLEKYIKDLKRFGVNVTDHKITSYFEKNIEDK